MPEQESIKAMLTGGNSRSLGRTEEIVALVLADKARLDELYACILDANEILRMRAGDAFEKISRQRPEWIRAYVPQLFTEVAPIDQASIQWHLAQILGEVELTPQQRATACKFLKRNLVEKKDWIVVNYSMETLARLSKDDAQLRAELLVVLKSLLSDSHKSIVARAHKLIATLEACR